VQHNEEKVDGLDACERRDNAAQTVDEEMVAQEARCTDRPVLDAT